MSVSANHLQKLRLSFQMSTPLGNAFKPHQVYCCFYLPLVVFLYNSWLVNSVDLQAFLRLRHETKVEHTFVVGRSGKKFEITLVKFFFFLNNFISMFL